MNTVRKSSSAASELFCDLQLEHQSEAERPFNCHEKSAVLLNDCLELERVRQCQRSMNSICENMRLLEEQLKSTAIGIRESRMHSRVPVELDVVDKWCLRDTFRELQSRAAVIAALSEDLCNAQPLPHVTGETMTTVSKDTYSAFSSTATLAPCPHYTESHTRATKTPQREMMEKKFNSPRVK